MAAGKPTFTSRLLRRRVFKPEELEQGNLRRCLNFGHLMSLGLGSSLGVGVYVLLGSVALNTAGPAVVVSVLVAGVAALLAGLCYAEFASRVPKAGSAYIYTFVTLGEFAAFIVGWNIILESLFGTASLARGFSLYLDSMTNHSMTNWLRSVAPLNAVYLSPYFDLLAFFLVMALGVVMAIGVLESSYLNIVLLGVSGLVYAVTIGCGAYYADPMNWSVPSANVPVGFGTGGFFPYGICGALKGAAICFYGFVGFDVISFTGEEALNPRRSMPRAILTVIGVVCIIYCAMAIVVTMMAPYYLLDPIAAAAGAFSLLGWEWARWFVGIGALFALLASILGALLPLPRLIYSMALDGFFFGWFAKVSGSRKSPTIATVVPVAVIAVLASVFDLEQLLMMMCIGSLLSYTVVAVCVIVFRYESEFDIAKSTNFIGQIFGFGERVPTNRTAKIVGFTLVAFVITCISLALVSVFVERPLIPAAILHVVALFLILIMTVQPSNSVNMGFKTPLVPLVPCLSIYFNLHLMVLLSGWTWLRVAIWIFVGIVIYLIGMCCCRRNVSTGHLEDNLKSISHKDVNGKSHVQIIVESPTPTNTIGRGSVREEQAIETTEMKSDNAIELYEKEVDIMRINASIATEEILIQQAIIDYNEEREAKIIDLLDQVIQAEEDTYGEVPLHDKVDDTIEASYETMPHIKSLSELSDAESDASISNVLSKYDVIVQVHREDMPKVNEDILEEPELVENESKEEKEPIIVEVNYEVEKVDVEDHEKVTFFNESETASRTDESGYSDTTDKNQLSESVEEKVDDTPRIPSPPPFNEKYFASPTFKKSFTISVRSKKPSVDEEKAEPRESVQSNNSYDDNNIVFGSARQMSFMSKLNNIFQTKIDNPEEKIEEEKIKRSNSTGNLSDRPNLEVLRERPQIFLDLKKELLARNPTKDKSTEIEQADQKDEQIEEDEIVEDISMSKADLKSKLESIFASGGPRLLKPRIVKSNPPTPEESYVSDTSSTESIPKMPKMEKNDTLKRQRHKFGEVLNSFRLSFQKDDAV